MSTQYSEGVMSVEIVNFRVRWMSHIWYKELNKFSSLFFRRDAISQVEQVRDQMQVQQGALTDANHREGHFCRLRESKQEKLSKLQLQHQHAVAAWQENIERNERWASGQVVSLLWKLWQGFLKQTPITGLITNICFKEYFPIKVN